MDKLLELFDKDKVDVLGWIVITVVYVLNEIGKRIRKRRERKHKGRFELKNDAEVKATIDNILWQTLSIYDACRVYVMQFHNGDYYITGQPRLRCTITNEVVFPGVTALSPNYNGVQVSSYTYRLMQEADRNEYVYVQSAHAADEFMPGLADMMHLLELKSFVLIKIADPKTRNLVAILGLHFPIEHALNLSPQHPQNIPKLLYSKKRLETIFDRYPNPG